MNKRTQKELLDIVQKNYERIASGFSETRQKRLWPELLGLFKKVKNEDSLLDVGCGNGRLLEAFLDKNIEYLGVDPSQELIAEAQKRHPDCKFVLGDILNLGKIKEHSFDYVASIAVLHHLPSKELRINALKQLRNKIKPEGEIILTVWNFWSQKKYRKLIFKFFLLKLLKKNKMDFGDILFDWKKDKDKFLSKRYYHAFTSGELRSIINKAGLYIKKLYKDKYNYYLVLKK